MKIAVIGGGNGSYAAIADFTEAGHEVLWYRRNLASFAELLDSRQLKVIDHKGERKVDINPTDDIAAALRGAELVMIPTPAFAQADIADLIAPHLENGQVIYLPPGSFGSYVMYDRIRKAGSTADVLIAETGTLPWLARKQGQSAVRITTRASRLPTGVLPQKREKEALAVIERAFPGAIEPAGDVLSGALMNAGPIIHPPLILMNAGPIEHFDRWDIHNEGTQPAIRRVHDALDAERMAIREALGYGAPHFPLSDHYQTNQWMYGNLAHDKLVDSGDWHEKLNFEDHRYLTEDIEVGLALLVSVGEWAGVAVPTATGLLAVASAVTNRNLRNTGRTFENLGLADTPVKTLQQRLKDGF